MTTDEIAKLAREAGLKVGTNISGITLVGSPAEIGLAHITIDELTRFAHLVRAQALEEAINIIEEYRIPVGNSAAGEMACEWTYDALHRIRDAIRAMKGET